MCVCWGGCCNNTSVLSVTNKPKTMPPDSKTAAGTKATGRVWAVGEKQCLANKNSCSNDAPPACRTVGAHRREQSAPPPAHGRRRRFTPSILQRAKARGPKQRAKRRKTCGRVRACTQPCSKGAGRDATRGKQRAQARNRVEALFAWRPAAAPSRGRFTSTVFGNRRGPGDERWAGRAPAARWGLQAMGAFQSGVRHHGRKKDTDDPSSCQPTDKSWPPFGQRPKGLLLI